MTHPELAQENLLRPNGLGGYLISYSRLASWARCPLESYYEARAKLDPELPQPKQLSITAYGTVIHAALQQMQTDMHEGRPQPLERAVKMFEHYWHPSNIGAICPPVEDWLPRQTYGGLLERGRIALRDMYALLRKEDSYLLGLEYPFELPMQIEGRTHTMRGFIDRLTIRKQSGKPYISLDDFKAGKQHTWLRYNMQGTTYAWASLQPQFWEAFSSDVVERLEESFDSHGYRLHLGSPGDKPLASRRFRWVNVKDIKFVDGGWRNERDYARLYLAVDAYVRANEAGVYAPTMTGEVCRHCAFRETCGGIGLPHENAGAP